MPISDEALQKEKNHFIAVKGEATVGQAVAAFKAMEAEPWWHLIVQMKDGSWAVSRFRDLAAPLRGVAGAAEIHLNDLENLTPVTAVEHDSIDAAVAQSQARKSTAGLLILTENGLPVGILVAGTKRGGGGSSSAGLSELGGKAVDLKSIGAILLSSSRKPANRPKPAS